MTSTNLIPLAQLIATDLDDLIRLEDRYGRPENDR